MDPAEADTKQYYRQLVKENKDYEEQECLDIKFRKQHIVDNNEYVKPLLYAPTAARILTMSSKELEEVKAIKLIKSDEFSEKGSDYIAYIQRAKSTRDIQKGLYKVKIKYADATHVSYAYRLENAKGPFKQEYFDDDETDVGRTMLQAIKDRAASSVAVYVVRYYGGVCL